MSIYIHKIFMNFPNASISIDNLVIGYWKIRGLQRKIALLCEYVGAKYELKFYEVTGEAPNYDGSSWFDVKHSLGLDFPNLPYLFDGDYSMTECIPIMRYIANKYNKDLLGKTKEEYGKVAMLNNILYELNTKVTTESYKTDDKETIVNNGIKCLEPISKFVGENKFLVGDEPTICDFHYYEAFAYLRALDKDTFESKFPNLLKVFNNIAELPAIKEFHASDRCDDLPFNNVMAKVNARE